MTNLSDFIYDRLRTVKRKLYSTSLNLFCDFLLRWGGRLGISPNFRGRMLWKANRRDIVPRDELYRFLLQPQPCGQYYTHAPKWSWRSQTIIDMLSPYISKEASFLEIGSNLGRNLNHLLEAGYGSLRGMEISRHSVKRLRSFYPSLSQITIDIGPAEESIKKLDDHSVDVIVTMATLEQVHPDSRYLFQEIARVANRYVLAIEPKEGHRSHFQYPWDIKKEFSEAGLLFVESRPWSALWSRELRPEFEWADDMHPYEAFLFRAKGDKA